MFPCSCCPVLTMSCCWAGSVSGSDSPVLMPTFPGIWASLGEQVTATGGRQPACGPFSALLPVATKGQAESVVYTDDGVNFELHRTGVRSHSALLLRDFGQVTLPFLGSVPQP